MRPQGRSSTSSSGGGKSSKSPNLSESRSQASESRSSQLQSPQQPEESSSPPEPPPPTKYVAKQLVKTRFCKHFLRGYCRYERRCAYAHDSAELMPRPNLLKTKICVDFLSGSCSSDRCTYAHGLGELRSQQDTEPADSLSSMQQPGALSRTSTSASICRGSEPSQYGSTITSASRTTTAQSLSASALEETSYPAHGLYRTRSEQQASSRLEVDEFQSATGGLPLWSQASSQPKGSGMDLSQQQELLLKQHVVNSYRNLMTAQQQLALQQQQQQQQLLLQQPMQQPQPRLSQEQQLQQLVANWQKQQAATVQQEVRRQQLQGQAQQLLLQQQAVAWRQQQRQIQQATAHQQLAEQQRQFHTKQLQEHLQQLQVLQALEQRDPVKPGVQAAKHQSSVPDSNSLRMFMQQVIETNHAPEDKVLICQLLAEVANLIEESDGASMCAEGGLSAKSPPVTAAQRWRNLAQAISTHRIKTLSREGKYLLAIERCAQLSASDEQMATYIFLREPSWLRMFPGLLGSCKQRLSARVHKVNGTPATVDTFCVADVL
eukprot:gnl/TRDRNA2_/TRDRNA2_168742_c3_seq4.p1 gnl/TRDRNA2_/TRDRNA2_168742_c3~~gnl/TRDRNA2_/TRDRNA2_168742_c3_seq4.p1  ORF type:complete len:547 (+),score=111.00 gnl/TRDRNA2_/TRDRNA2_168742_c3_seq4:124-1764(+)